MLLLVSWPAAAQFTPADNGPASRKYSHIQTESYDVVYPRGLDSLGAAYAAMLERVKEPVSRSIGFVPNQFGKKRFPVLLKTSDAWSNGSVAWTPHRMELITLPEADAPLPLPWMEQLVVHESRHVAQMQYLQAPRYRFGKIISGELFGGALAALYCGPQFFEGDAVAAETELSFSGRGREAAFLEYYRVCFDAGEFRNYWRWRWGSHRLFTPDYYAPGYVSFAGLRGLYDEPLFTKRYFDRLFERRGFPLSVWNKTVRDVSGKPFKETFADICDTLDQRWKRDMQARAPFMPMTLMGTVPEWYTENTDNCYLHEHVFDVHSGLCESPSLMLTNPDGRGERRVSRFSYHGTGLKAEPVRERLYWSEIVPDVRWTDRSWSEIYYCHHDGRHHRLTRHTRYYNPAPSPDGSALAVTEYREDGSCAAVVIDPDDGHEIARYPAPDGMQVTETEWAGDVLFAAAVTGDGIGIYKVESWIPVLKPRFAGIKELWHHDGHIYYTSDRSGVDELYSVCMESGRERQLSSTPYGASEFQFNEAADTLYYSAPTPQGRLLFKTPADSLIIRELSGFSPKAPVLLDSGMPTAIDMNTPVLSSAPQDYSRAAHLMRFHSWLPVYFDFDGVADLSFETIYKSLGLGATAFFQNLLGTMDGSVGYKAAPVDGNWFHSGHAKFTYRGLYPIIEASASFGERQAYDYYNYRLITNGEPDDGMIKDAPGRLSWNASLRTYIPFNFSSGGWNRGFVPQLTYGISGDRFSSDLFQVTREVDEPEEGEESGEERILEKKFIGRGTFSNLSRLSVSMRAYTMLSAPPSCTYPKLGIGAELGYSFRPGAITFDAVSRSEKPMFNSNVFAFVYGYLPGLAPDQGMRLSAMYQRSLGDSVFSEGYATTSPRGFSVSSLMSELGYPGQAKFTLDYSIPFLSVDWGGMCPVAYVRNFEAEPHFDISCYWGCPGRPSGSLISVGTDLSVCLGNLLWIPYTTRIGVSWSFNGGSLYDELVSINRAVSRNSFSLVFDMDF